MENVGSITASADGKRPILERVLNRVFRCSHRQQTRPITLKGETFAICLDCGSHVPYSLEVLQPKRAAKPAPPQSVEPKQDTPKSAEPAKSSAVLVRPSATPPKPSAAPAKPSAAPAKPSTAPPKSAAPAPKPSVTAPKKSPPPNPVAAPLKRSNAQMPILHVRSTIRKWTREGVWLGLLAIGFAGGIYYSGQQHQAPVVQAVVQPPVLPPKTEQAVVPAQIWSVPAVPQPTPAKTVMPDAPPAPAARRPNEPLRLQSQGHFVLLAHEADAALDLSKHPGKLKELIQAGALLSVRRGTAVRIVEKQERVVHVAILEGPARGEEGWVSATRVQ